jgi:small conductance mechanosensitive channel
MILEELGANITVLMGGVAVIGLAVAFGAQNLIKDYFYGFVMLLENQYMLNDTVRIGGVTGQVERITLRMTVLRDGSGIVHFIPNGTINSVSNETHGWSRAVCEIGIGHDEDLEQVIKLLNCVSEELVRDKVVGPLLLEKPSEPAIENLGGPNINLKVAVKTVPNKHGSVKQEWLRRIKQSLTLNRIAPPYSGSGAHPDLRRWDDSRAA